MSETFAFKRRSGMYPEQRSTPPTRLESIWQDHVLFYRSLLTSQHSLLSRVVLAVNLYDTALSGLNDAGLDKEVQELRRELRSRGTSFRLICRAFAVVKEMAGRSLGLRHRDVQLMGGWALLNGTVAEIQAGEGKTLTATLPACTFALSGIPTHIITANHYLADRDYHAMKPLYEKLGIRTALLTNGMPPADRRQAYLSDVVYSEARELVFDYLKDHLIAPQRSGRITHAVQRLYGGFGNSENLYLRGLHYAVIDDADTVLIDQALVPVVISGNENNIFEEAVYRLALRFARQLEPATDFVSNGQQVEFTDQGSARCAELSSGTGGFWNVTKIREMLVIQALTALHCLQRGVQYAVENHKIAPIGESASLLGNGVQQMVECKEGCPMTSQKTTLARITFQRFFKRYHQLAGMTDTARDARRQLWSLYRLKVSVIPPSGGVRTDYKAEERCFATSEEKLAELVGRAEQIHLAGSPVVIGTPSPEAAGIIGDRLAQSNLPHSIIAATQDESEVAAMAGAGQPGRISVVCGSAGLGTTVIPDPDAAAGGLHLILSEKNRYERLDRQLTGRCGRPGDPLPYVIYVSLEDELFQTIPLPWILELLSWILKRFPVTGQRLALKTSQLIQRRMARRHHLSCRAVLRHEDALDRQLAFSGEGE